MKATGEWGKFFPGYFAPNPYDESISGFYFPLSLEEQQKLGFRAGTKLERKSAECVDASQIPDALREVKNKDELTSEVYWDSVFKRQFRITKKDLEISEKLNIPILSEYYIRRMQENLQWIPFDGELRNATCAKSGKPIKTNWPSEYDDRILCEEEYLKFLH